MQWAISISDRFVQARRELKFNSYISGEASRSKNKNRAVHAQTSNYIYFTILLGSQNYCSHYLASGLSSADWEFPLSYDLAQALHPLSVSISVQGSNCNCTDKLRRQAYSNLTSALEGDEDIAVADAGDAACKYGGPVPHGFIRKLFQIMIHQQKRSDVNKYI